MAPKTSEADRYRKALEAARATITYLEHRNRHHIKIIRQQQIRIHQLEGKNHRGKTTP